MTDIQTKDVQKDATFAAGMWALFSANLRSARTSIFLPQIPSLPHLAGNAFRLETTPPPSTQVAAPHGPLAEQCW